MMDVYLEMDKANVATQLEMAVPRVEGYGKAAVKKLCARDWARMTTLELILMSNAFQSSDADPSNEDVSK